MIVEVELLDGPRVRIVGPVQVVRHGTIVNGPDRVRILGLGGAEEAGEQQRASRAGD